MPIKIKLPPAITNPKTEEVEKETQATITLKIKKTLDGNLLIDDHEHMDIVVVSSTNKVMTIPKPYAEKEAYSYQKEFMYEMFKGGVLVLDSTQGGAKFGVLEASYPNESDVSTLQSLLFRIDKYIKETSSSEVLADEYEQNIEDRFTDPNEEDSTEYGEIPPYEDTPEGQASANTNYNFYGYGYLY